MAFCRWVRFWACWNLWVSEEKSHQNKSGNGVKQTVKQHRPTICILTTICSKLYHISVTMGCFSNFNGLQMMEFLSRKTHCCFDDLFEIDLFLVDSKLFKAMVLVLVVSFSEKSLYSRQGWYYRPQCRYEQLMPQVYLECTVYQFKYCFISCSSFHWFFEFSFQLQFFSIAKLGRLVDSCLKQWHILLLCCFWGISGISLLEIHSKQNSFLERKPKNTPRQGGWPGNNWNHGAPFLWPYKSVTGIETIPL